MSIKPILPMWLMAIVSVLFLVCKRRKGVAFVRQIIIVVLIFLINLRPFVSGEIKAQGHSYNQQIVFVVDDTISMLAKDAAGGNSRLDAAKADCRRIIEVFPNAKFSVLSFHNTANILTPFTGEVGHVTNVLDSMIPLGAIYAKGSNVSIVRDMLLGTVKRAKKKEAGSTLFVFLGDGENTDEKKSQSFEEIAKYIDGGAVLGYGTTTGTTMEQQGYFDEEPELIMDSRDFKFEPAITRIDETVLNTLAKETGVAYFHMTEEASVEAVIAELKKVKPDSMSANTRADEPEERTLAGAHELYPYLVFPLAAMLMLEVFLMIRKKR